MIELAFLATWKRLINWGLAPIIARRTVAADAETLRTFLTSPANQWRLARGFVDVAALQPAGECCDAALHLPLGARVPASLCVTARTRRVLAAELTVGRRTVAWTTWILTPGHGTADVDLAVQLDSRSLATRLALLLGGRHWIARRLDATLATLATTSARFAEDLIALPAAADLPARPTALQQPTVGVGHAADDR